MFTVINKSNANLFIVLNRFCVLFLFNIELTLTGPEISLDLAAGELSDEVDGAGAGLADEIDEWSVCMELYLARLRGEG